MKVLLDPIYTAAPARCSANMKCRRLVSKVLDDYGRTDVFFYWLVPTWLTPEERAWYPDHPNIRLIDYPYLKDRLREYQRYIAEYDAVTAFNGDLWDWDAMITFRTQQVPTIKVVATSPREKGLEHLKRVMLFEDMPVMDFKSISVAMTNFDVQNLATLAGYYAADSVSLGIGHERDGIVAGARQYFAPSKVLELQGKIRVVSPAVIDDFALKDQKNWYRPGERPFCLGFTGRMSNGITNIRSIYEVMEKQWILRGDEQFRVIISTVSTGVKIKPPDFVHFQNSPREEFWRLLKEEMDVCIYMAAEAGFGMSVMEPLMFGTPIVLGRFDWSVALVGKEYPFFAKNMPEAYGMVRAFLTDYEGMYARFAEWQAKHLRPRFAPGGVYESNLYDAWYDELVMHEQNLATSLAKKRPALKNNEVVKLLAKDCGDEFVIFDAIRKLEHLGKLTQLAQKTEPGDRDRRNISFSTPWNQFRRALIEFHGFRDASTKVGHMVRVIGQGAAVAASTQ